MLKTTSPPPRVPRLLACLFPEVVRELERLRRQCATQAALLDHLRNEVPLEQQYECKLCMDAPIQAVLLPCGHTLACAECGRGLRECPVCRSEVEETTMLHLVG